MVGAGPAGSSTARYAARRGLKVLLLDRRRVIGWPVQCGEYVAHNSEVERIFRGVSDLDDLMKASYAAKQIDTDLTRIISPRGRVYELPFKGFTVDRTAMDQGIAAQAVEEGAELMKGVAAIGIKGNKVVTSHAEYEGRLIVGADGPLSGVARWAGLPHPVSAPAMSATIPGDFSSITDMYFGDLAPGGYAWIIPKGKTANVGIGVWPQFRGNLRPFFDAFVKRLNLPPAHGTGGYVPILGPVKSTVKGDIILVGDAAGHVMATNGGGINASMICGRIAGESVADHIHKGVPLAEYERRWRELVGGPLRRSRNIRKLADHFFVNESRLEHAMSFLGAKRMGRAIRCKRLFFAR